MEGVSFLRPIGGGANAAGARIRCPRSATGRNGRRSLACGDGPGRTPPG